jgi:hypothetical protein
MSKWDLLKELEQEAIDKMSDAEFDRYLRNSMRCKECGGSGKRVQQIAPALPSARVEDADKAAPILYVETRTVPCEHCRGTGRRS